MVDKLETWRNAAKGKTGIIKLDARGMEKHEVIGGGQTFTVTREERILNGDRCVSADLNSFTNGRLIPVGNVQLYDGDETEADIASSPNLMSDDELKALFTGHWQTFRKKIDSISNVITLQRLLDIGDEKDATVKQMKAVQDRMFALDPTAFPVPGESIGTVKEKLGINPINLGDL